MTTLKSMWANDDRLARVSALERENIRLRAALSKIAFITSGIDTPATSNAAHYEAVNALTASVSAEVNQNQRRIKDG